MKLIQNGQALIGMLESGELNERLTETCDATFSDLLDMSNENPKVKFKGEISLKLKLEVANGMITINADVASKTPKRAYRSSAYWITEGGKLSTEHPQQHDMFSGPREARDRA